MNGLYSQELVNSVITMHIDGNDIITISEELNISEDIVIDIINQDTNDNIIFP